jgi:hypothetical protein
VDQGIADAWRTTLESAGVRVLVAGEGSFPKHHQADGR